MESSNYQTLLKLLFYNVKGNPNFRSHLANLPGSKHWAPKSSRGQKSLSKEPEIKRKEHHSLHAKSTNEDPVPHAGRGWVTSLPFQVCSSRKLQAPVLPSIVRREFLNPHSNSYKLQVIQKLSVDPKYFISLNVMWNRKLHKFIFRLSSAPGKHLWNPLF